MRAKSRIATANIDLDADRETKAGYVIISDNTDDQNSEEVKSARNHIML